MKIKEVNSKLESINNQIEYYLTFKELETLKFENGDYESVNAYRELCTCIDEEINKLYLEQQRLIKFLDNHLELINSYDELKQRIIYYKEESKEKYTWDKIAELVNYSEKQCRRIYSKYKKQRYID